MCGTPFHVRLPPRKFLQRPMRKSQVGSISVRTLQCETFYGISPILLSCCSFLSFFFFFYQDSLIILPADVLMSFCGNLCVWNHRSGIITANRCMVSCVWVEFICCTLIGLCSKKKKIKITTKKTV